MLRRTWITGLLGRALLADAPPLRIAHRESSMRLVGDPRLFEVAAKIPGLLGVELQVVSGAHSLLDREMQRRYKREALRWGKLIPSLSGPFAKGTTIHSPSAGYQIAKAIEAAEFLGSGVILLPFFRENSPDMSKESSYGPLVEMLQQVAPRAADAGVTLGLENSLSPADNAKLADVVGRASVRIYYDIHNAEYYGHKNLSVPGVKVIGKERICQVHVKNEAMLLDEPGKVDWTAALQNLRAIGYEGWLVLETAHSGEQQLIESTKKNIEFLKRTWRQA